MGLHEMPLVFFNIYSYHIYLLIVLINTDNFREKVSSLW